MADDTNEDSWLYGTSNPDSTTNEEERLGAENASDEAGIEKVNSQELLKAENEALAAITQGNGLNNLPDKDDGPPGEELVDFEDPAHEMEEDEEATAAATVADTTDGDEQEEVKKSEENSGGDEDDEAEEDDEDDDSDDDINVVIGDIKAAPSTYNINKRSNLLAGASSQEKSKSTQVGKFSIEDFEGVGSINGVAAHEFSIDSLEDKPWRKPGADITDYFNYGFNEETWRSYCERQKRFRVAESGVGLASLTQNLNPQPERQTEGNIPAGPPPGMPFGPIPMGPLGEQVQMPPPGMMPPSGIHQPPHQGIPPRFASAPRGPRPVPQPGTKENAIQVMTAECREYSRPGQMPPNFGGQGPGEEAFFHEPEPFDYGYEPTQDSQWGGDNPNWVPSGIKELTPGPNSGPPQQISGPPGILPTPMGVPPPQMGGPPPQLRHPHPQPPMMGGMPPPNMGMGPPPMGMMMGPGGPGGPPMHMPMGPPRMMGPNGPPDRSEDERERRRRERDWDRERERDRDRERMRRERSRSREKSRRRSKSREKEREKEREKDRDKDRDKERDRDRDRERERDRDRGEKVEESERSDDERERRRRDRDRERDRDRDRERSRRERSRSREKSRRRSKSRDKERDRSSKTGTSSTTSSSSRSDKKKSHRKEDEE